MFKRSQTTTLLQIFCELSLCSQVIFKSMKVADVRFWWSSKCEWDKTPQQLSDHHWCGWKFLLNIMSSWRLSMCNRLCIFTSDGRFRISRLNVFQLAHTSIFKLEWTKFFLRSWSFIQLLQHTSQVVLLVRYWFLLQISKKQSLLVCDFPLYVL